MKFIFIGVAFAATMWLLHIVIRDVLVEAVKPLLSELKSITSELKGVNEKLERGINTYEL